MHVRGPPPAAKVISNEIMEYTKNFEQKMSVFLTPSASVPPADYEKLGAKNPDKSVYDLKFSLRFHVIHCFHLLFISYNFLGKLRSLLKQILKNYQKKNGSVHSVVRNSKVRITFVNIFSTSMLKKWLKLKLRQNTLTII